MSEAVRLEVVEEGSFRAFLQAVRRDLAALGSARTVLMVERSAVAMEDILRYVNERAAGEQGATVPAEVSFLEDFDAAHGC